MCGIVGAYHADWFDVGAAVRRLAHRGPDGSGVVEHLGVIHGHTRLAIFDTTAASAQPFLYRDGCLSYNGELWNFRQLRADLEQFGHTFSTTGDTEVVAASLVEWGAAAIDKFDGMFCFAWSSPRERILVRDRFGKLPLYYVTAFNGICWASERGGLGNLAGLADALRPGHLLDLASGVARCYYEIPFIADATPDGVEAFLVRGVEKRLQSDVPVCVLLSGGIDSSLTTAIAAKLRPDVVAYTCYVNDDSLDLVAAREVAAYLKIEHRIVRVSAPDDAAIRTAIRIVEVPNRTAIETTTLCVQLAAAVRADGFKVAISGEASDELFGGYGTLARRATSDTAWRTARMQFFAKMGRSDFHRVNKSFMRHGVEVRMPFCERDLVETVMSLGRKACPPNKKLLIGIAERWIPRKIARRQKLTFHGGAGVIAHCETRAKTGGRDAYYNQILREIFGRIVRG